MDNYRGITVTPIISKLFESSILPCLSDIFLLSTLQFGFTEGLCMLMAVFIINEARAETKHTTFDSLFLMTVDSKKAFDVVDHIIMMDKFYENIPNSSLWTVIKDFYSGLTSKVKWKGIFSHSFSIKQGVRQRRLDTGQYHHIPVQRNNPSGNIRSELKEINLNIDARLSIARRTLYFLIKTGVHGSNGLNPATSFKIYQCYVLPRPICGLEILPLNNSQMDKSNKFHLKNLKSFQSLPIRTASCAVLLLIGALALEAEIHKRQLTFLHNVLSCENNTIRDLSERQILMNMQNPTSFFNKIESLLSSSYEVPEITALQQCLPTKLSWKSTVKISIREFWTQKLKSDISQKSSLNT
ncbi:unnamed protein product [Mytilus coruscus]|uniref:Uncharacterized protein n=1 Tax=Mytilus coruscus TaxID=42192 RepID=A0A6J8DXK0_MYTCO|nr:unnamed protein product [Mytilus coruscus]